MKIIQIAAAQAYSAQFTLFALTDDGRVFRLSDDRARWDVLAAELPPPRRKASVLDAMDGTP